MLLETGFFGYKINNTLLQTRWNVWKKIEYFWAKYRILWKYLKQLNDLIYNFWFLLLRFKIWKNIFMILIHLINDTENI